MTLLPHQSWGGEAGTRGLGGLGRGWPCNSGREGGGPGPETAAGRVGGRAHWATG